ncbi:hypothetical protein ABDD95_19430 [Mucilaginibacter sp. PAMB04274]|uniref:hypothetical protein n=1 Tax=Mucilaginibacter sp. PAMB04274 TaxID=3138568 RepID=UPI0031F602F5
MEQLQLIRIFRESVKTGSEKATAELTENPNYLTKAAAYRKYGRSLVDRWFQEKLLELTPVRGRPSQLGIDKNTLEAIAAASNRITYLPVAER